MNRLLGLARFAPLIKAVRRYEAAARGKKVFERRPIRQSLGARVDNLVADRLILGPETHEAPARRPRFHRHLLRKGKPLPSLAAVPDRKLGGGITA